MKWRRAHNLSVWFYSSKGLLTIKNVLYSFLLSKLTPFSSGMRFAIFAWIAMDLFCEDRGCKCSPALSFVSHGVFLPWSFLPAGLVLLIYSVLSFVVYGRGLFMLFIARCFIAPSCVYADRFWLISYGDPRKGYYIFRIAITIPE